MFVFWRDSSHKVSSYRDSATQGESTEVLEVWFWGSQAAVAKIGLNQHERLHEKGFIDLLTLRKQPHRLKDLHDQQVTKSGDKKRKSGSIE